MFKFRRSIKIFPGFRVNISKSGVSTSLKIAKGLSANISKNGAYFNVGIPKTNIKSRINIKESAKTTESGLTNNEVSEYDSGFEEIKSSNIGNLSDDVGKQIVQDIKLAHEQRIILKKDLLVWRIKSVLLFLIKAISFLLIFGFFYKKPQEWFQESKIIIEGIKDHLKNTNVKLDIEFDETSDLIYKELVNKYIKLTNSEKIRDITNAKENNGVKDRSGASQIIKRKKTQFDQSMLDIIDCKNKPFRLKNINGLDIYIYPCHLILTDGKGEIDIMEIGKPTYNFQRAPFIEEERVPKDSEIIRYTWKYVNKSGGPDKRFKDNHQIPVMLYGELTLETENGLYEKFKVSNCKALEEFMETFHHHTNYLSK